MKKKNSLPSDISSTIHTIERTTEVIKKDDSLKDLYQDLVDAKQILIDTKRGIKALSVLFITLLITSGSIIAYQFYNIFELEKINHDLRFEKVSPMMEKILDIQRIEKGDSIKREFNYFTKDGKPITYSDLNKLNDSLIKLITDSHKSLKISLESYNDIKGKNENLERQLEIIKSNFSIYFVPDPDDPTSMILKSVKADSAYPLLRMAGKGLRYDTKKEVWYFYKDSI